MDLHEVIASIEFIIKETQKIHNSITNPSEPTNTFQVIQNLRNVRNRKSITDSLYKVYRGYSLEDSESSQYQKVEEIIEEIRVLEQQSIRILDELLESATDSLWGVPFQFVNSRNHGVLPVRYLLAIYWVRNVILLTALTIVDS